MNKLTVIRNQQAVTTSLLIAEKFQKRHADVLRSIKDLQCSKDFTERIFALSEYVDSTGRKLPMYYITRDGFALLAFGFNGKTADRFKEEYILAFNAMEEALRNDPSRKLLQVYSRRIIANEARKCPRTHWCIFEQSAPVLIQVETFVGVQCEFDLIDSSIGRLWANHRKEKFWTKASTTFDYVFSDKRPIVYAKCYDNAELSHFKDWLHDVYMKTHLIDYLQRKYASNHFMLERVQKFIPKLLAA